MLLRHWRWMSDWYLALDSEWIKSRGQQQEEEEAFRGEIIHIPLPVAAFSKLNILVLMISLTSIALYLASITLALGLSFLTRARTLCFVSMSTVNFIDDDDIGEFKLIDHKIRDCTFVLRDNTVFPIAIGEEFAGAEVVEEVEGVDYWDSCIESCQLMQSARVSTIPHIQLSSLSLTSPIVELIVSTLLEHRRGKMT